MSQKKFQKPEDQISINGQSEESANKDAEKVSQKGKEMLQKLDNIESMGTVTVQYGANQEELNVSGSSVATVRASLLDAFNIPKDAVPFVNGEQVDENYVLQTSQVLEFVKQAGVKGRRHFHFVNFS